MNLEVGDIFSSKRKDGTEFLSIVVAPPVRLPNASGLPRNPWHLVKVREQGKITEVYICEMDLQVLKVQKARDNFVRNPHKNNKGKEE